MAGHAYVRNFDHHGHLNKKTPRRNGFWPSLYRLCQSLIIDTDTLNKKVAHNYSTIKRTTEKRSYVMHPEEMRRQQIYYSTKKDHCNCSENKLASSILSMDVPCSHRLRLWEQFGDCPSFHIKLEQQFDKLIFDANVLPPNTIVNPYDENHGAIMYAASIIRRFSCYKNKKEIEEFVTAHYNQEQGNFFLLGEEVSLSQLIYNGIHHFMEKRKAQKIAKKPFLITNQ